MRRFQTVLIIAVTIILSVFILQRPNQAIGQDEGWKDFPLKLQSVDKKRGLKIITPSVVMQGKKSPLVTTYMKGKANGASIILIDENDNGNYNDLGTDLILIGKTNYAIPLSSIINIKNKLYHIKIEGKISLKPFEGETGKIDLVSKYKSLVPLSLVILKDTNNNYFDAAKNKKMLLPCGNYSLWLGYIEQKSHHVAIKQGGMDTIEVKNAKKPIKIKWGSPLKIDFKCTVDEKAKVPYNSIKVIGSAGEEYYNFEPMFMPLVEGKDSKGVVAFRGSFMKGG